MAELNIVSAKLTGNPGPSGWAQIHEFTPEDPEKRKIRGHFIAVISTTNAQQGIESVTVGREILTRLHEEYFGKVEGTVFNTLKSAVEKVVGEFKELLGQIEIAAVAYVDGVVYSAAFGGAQVSILRSGMLATILDSGAFEVAAASGYPQEGDMLSLSTSSFTKIINQGVLKESLLTQDVQLAAENLVPLIHSQVDSGSVGVVVAKFTNKKEESVNESDFIEELSTTDSSPQTAFTENPFVTRTKQIRNSILSIGKNLIDKLPQKKIYVQNDFAQEEEGTQSKKTTLSVGVILIAILLISIVFGIIQKTNKDSKSKYSTRLTMAQSKLDESLGLITLDTQKAREVFNEAKSTANTLKSEGVKDKELDLLLTKIQEKQGTILGEYHLTPETYLDLSIVSDNLKGDKISTSNETMYILDKSGKKIISVAFGTKKTQVVAGPDQVESPFTIASYEDRVFVLNDFGIYEVGKNKVKSVEKDWEGAVIPSLYASNIYLLDKLNNTIWRYAGSGTTFGSKARWIAPGIDPDFSKVNSIAIDGSIWVLTDSGKLVKFTMGSPVNIPTDNLYPGLTSANGIYTNETLNSVYILDKQNKRVVVIGKDGKYKAQYIDEKIGSATDLSVSEKEKTLILLSGDKLLKIELKHL